MTRADAVRLLELVGAALGGDSRRRAGADPAGARADQGGGTRARAVDGGDDGADQPTGGGARRGRPGDRCLHRGIAGEPARPPPHQRRRPRPPRRPRRRRCRRQARGSRIPRRPLPQIPLAPPIPPPRRYIRPPTALLRLWPPRHRRPQPGSRLPSPPSPPRRPRRPHPAWLHQQVEICRRCSPRGPPSSR